MKYADDFRAIARAALRGKWMIAVLTGFVASLIGAGIATGGGGFSSGNASTNTGGVPMSGEAMAVLLVVAAVVVVVALFMAAISLVVGGAGQLGYATFNLKLVDGKDIAFRDLFSQFHRIGAGVCMKLLVGLYTFLWSLLFINPGIVKSFSYAMTPYILAEHPEMTASQAIDASKYMMQGNKWRLFCLRFSFIGWILLSVVPVFLVVLILLIIAATMEPLVVGVAMLLLLPICVLATLAGSLLLTPYQEAANAAFYREISGTWPVPEEPVSPEYGTWTQT